MPEILTKHPEVVKELLASQGARCGAGVTPRVLEACPPAGLCGLEAGELCVFGPAEVGLMTQLSRTELCGGSVVAQPTAVGTGLLLAIAVSGSIRFVLGRARRRGGPRGAELAQRRS